MSRGLWFVAGAGAGVYAMVKARRAAETFTPEGWSDRLSSLNLGAQLFAEEFRTARDERESELRERLGLHSDGPLALVAPPTSTLPSPPSSKELN
ncbi:MAG: hypothetical protein EOO74_05600 [Myxococcales bacterium]|nr:MAG: hypothetical protein EOO74_05600 [Myxococcales bacterium]